MCLDLLILTHFQTISRIETQISNTKLKYVSTRSVTEATVVKCINTCSGFKVKKAATCRIDQKFLEPNINYW